MTSCPLDRKSKRRFQSAGGLGVANLSLKGIRIPDKKRNKPKNTHNQTYVQNTQPSSPETQTFGLKRGRCHLSSRTQTNSVTRSEPAISRQGGENSLVGPVSRLSRGGDKIGVDFLYDVRPNRAVTSSSPTNHALVIPDETSRLFACCCTTASPCGSFPKPKVLRPNRV